MPFVLASSLLMSCQETSKGAPGVFAVAAS